VLLLSPIDVKGTVDDALFRFLVELEVAKAQRLRYCVSVVSLTVAGGTGSDSSRLTERFADRVRASDIVMPNPESSWTLLLVDAQHQALVSIVQRITQLFGTLPWWAGGASYPETAVDAADLLTQALELGTRAQQDGRRELYLRNAGFPRGRIG
jgi:hypothetical protein